MKLYRRIPVVLLLGFCASSLTLSATEAPENAPQSTPEPKAERCLSLARIDSMQILDKRRIVFNMLGKEQFLNTLPYDCPGLRRDSTILYRTSLSELCDLDIITVMDTVGSGFIPGASCGLGTFMPISKREVENLKTDMNDTTR